MIIAIDPGFGGTGYAIWNYEKPFPDETGIITETQTQKLLPLEYRLVEMGSQLGKLLQQYAVFDKMCVIECPQYFDSGAGKVCAATGDLIKLSLLVGTYIDRASYYGYKIGLIEVNDWKGQLPKHIVEGRIRKLLGDSECEKFKSHVWDAVGIGLTAMGYAL